jgi:CMP-N-acetylneuraminic acid synthetase
VNIKTKTIGIILARAGSTRLKNKNLKKINGKSLIKITLIEAIKSKVFNKILIYSDISKKKLDLNLKNLENIKLVKREKKYSTSFITSEKTLLKLFEKKNYFRNYSNFILLQPTSPMRNFKHIKNAYKKFLESKKNSIVSVVLGKSKISKNNILRKNKNYKTNGAIYITKISFFKKYKKLFNKNSEIYLMNKKYSIDIDNISDFKVAKNYFKILKTSKAST